jgi:hypothetical protein
MHALALRSSALAITLLALSQIASPALSQGASAETEATVAVGNSELVGHWLRPVIALDTVTDHHLVLNPDGTAEQWAATPFSTDPPTAGTWEASADTLTLRMDGSEQASAPYFFFEGQLVFPNVEGNRRFWERAQ